jgi:hypothetical protein
MTMSEKTDNTVLEVSGYASILERFHFNFWINDNSAATKSSSKSAETSPCVKAKFRPTSIASAMPALGADQGDHQGML